MTDTLSRLAGPTVLSRSEAGTTIYDPSAGTIALKNALLVNNNPNIGGWVTLSLGTLATRANRLVSGLYVPPSATIKVPLDVILDGTVDDIRGRQVVDMSLSNMSVATAVAVINNTTDATSQATASWAAVNGRCYLMFIVTTHATAAAAPTSFTDTHTGITWTQVGTTITNAALTMALSTWRAQSSGTTNTTTTANFGITFTGCHIVIAAVTNADATGTNGSEAFTDGGTHLGSTVTSTGYDVIGNEMCGARFLAATSNAGGTSTPGNAFTELSDAAIATPTNTLTTAYALSPGTSGGITLTASTTDKMGQIVNFQDGTQPITCTLNGVVVT